MNWDEKETGWTFWERNMFFLKTQISVIDDFTGGIFDLLF